METKGIPPSIECILRRFQVMGREEKMQALVQYAKQLELLPVRYTAVDRSMYTIPECQSRVCIFPEIHHGLMHFYADVNVRQSPTIAAVLAILFTAVNEQPPQITLAIPTDFVRILMEGIGLHAREVGLNAMLTRLKRFATQAEQGTPLS